MSDQRAKLAAAYRAAYAQSRPGARTYWRLMQAAAKRLRCSGPKT